MLTLVVWTLVALVTAALVLVVAGAAGGQTWDVRGFVRDAVAGLRRRPAAEDGVVAAVPGEPVDASLDELFAAAEVDDPPYLAVEDLTETLARARQSASRGVSGLTRR